MDTKKSIIAVIIAVVVIAALGVFMWMRQPLREEPQAGEGGSEQGIATRSATAGNIIVPEEGDKNVPANVAVPTVVGPAGQQTTAKFRAFDIEAKGGTFMPDTIAVRVGDIVHINLTAVDKNYDFTQPDFGLMNISVAQGQKKVIEFQATGEGTFIFYCTSCGGPSRGPVGTIMIAPKE